MLQEIQEVAMRTTKSGLTVFCFMMTLFGSASTHAGKTMDFAIIGDMPYTGKQEGEFANLMKEVDNENLAFVVHAGDFQWDGLIKKSAKAKFPPCADKTFKNRLSLARNSRHPFIFTPGDNDWTDCHRALPRAYDPIERLSTLRKMFFRGDKSLGQRKIKLTRQSSTRPFTKFVENAHWTYGGVQFATLHLVGSNNNLGRTEAMDAEYKERSAANLAWLKEAFAQAKRNRSKAIMIIAQANPRFETTWTGKVQKRYMLQGLGIKPPVERRETGFDDFTAALEKEVLAFGKPVAYVHGDTHTFRVDKPLLGSKSRRIIENFTRVETFGAPDTHWVRVTIDTADPNVFRFRPEIVKKNRVKH